MSERELIRVLNQAYYLGCSITGERHTDELLRGISFGFSVGFFLAFCLWS